MSPETLSFLNKLDQFYNSENTSELKCFLEKTFRKAVDVNNQELIIASGNEYAGYLRVTGKLKESAEVYEKIIPYIRLKYGVNSREYASLLINMGNLYIADSAYIKSLEIFNEAEEILREFKEEDYILTALLNNRSSSFRMMGDIKSAKNDIFMALKLTDADPSRKAVSLINLCEILILSGEFERAENVIAKSLQIFEEKITNDPIHYANALSTAGEINFYLGNYPESKSYYEKSLREFRNNMGQNAMTERIQKNYDKVRRILEVYPNERT